MSIKATEEFNQLIQICGTGHQDVLLRMCEGLSAEDLEKVVGKAREIKARTDSEGKEVVNG